MFGSGGRLQTCIYVDAGTTHFLIDCGASALIGMRRWGVNPTAIDTILISHLHGDHFGGLPFLILEAQLISKRTRPLVLAGPPGLESRLRQAMEVFFPGSTQLQPRFSLEFIELPEGRPTHVGDLLAIPQAVIHASGAPAYALRLECGPKIIGYSGDTEWTEALLPVAKGADLFICEAYFFDKRIKYHLDYQTLLAHRAELGCKRLIITHLSHDLLQRIDSLELEYAEDGKQLLI